MKVTDYIVEFLIQKGIEDVFGYPGGVICHFMDSLNKHKGKIRGHVAYHEQGAAFAACGYAQAKNVPGVVYATSGPGATNLVTGIANAFFDSLPVIFFTGQVDTYADKGNFSVRQRGFQETDVISIVSSITKYAVCVREPEKIAYYLERAYYEATNGRPGPVLLDLPANVQRAEVEEKKLDHFKVLKNKPENYQEIARKLLYKLNIAKRPCLLIGAGIKQNHLQKSCRKLIELLRIPVVTSMPAFDLLPAKHVSNMGFIGANGHRYGNFVLGKSDLILSIGSRLDLKQVGNNRSGFATNARLIRLDIDSGELEFKVREDEEQYKLDLNQLLPCFQTILESAEIVSHSEWMQICGLIRNKLSGIDVGAEHQLIGKISEKAPENISVTGDVGHNQVWLAQAYRTKEGQQVYMSSGFGAMGYSLPASIGVYYATKQPVICFCGDGGLQMNIQELQFVKREKLPIMVVVLNNNALGMIRHFQEMNFEENYYQTTAKTGYSAVDMKKVARLYDCEYYQIQVLEDIEKIPFIWDKPLFVNVVLPEKTYLYPKFGRNKPIQDQEPFLDRELYKYLMGL